MIIKNKEKIVKEKKEGEKGRMKRLKGSEETGKRKRNKR